MNLYNIHCDVMKCFWLLVSDFTCLEKDDVLKRMTYNKIPQYRPCVTYIRCGHFLHHITFTYDGTSPFLRGIKA